MSISPLERNPSDIPEGFTWEDSADWCPERLKPYFRKRLNTKSAEFANLVEKVYEIWAENDFLPVELNPAPGNPIPACARQECGVSFDTDLPDEEDYPQGEDDPQFEWDLLQAEVGIAQAKEVCEGCPLAMQCLAASVTMPSITLNNRGGDHTAEVATYNMDDPRVNQYGVHGGYGESARRDINKALKRRRAER